MVCLNPARRLDADAMSIAEFTPVSGMPASGTREMLVNVSGGPVGRSLAGGCAGGGARQRGFVRKAACRPGDAVTCSVSGTDAHTKRSSAMDPGGPVRWIRESIASRRPILRGSGIHRVPAPDLAWLGAMDSGIHRVPGPDLAWFGAMDPGIHQGNRV